MTKKEKIEMQKDRMNRIIEWVRTCDNKTSIIMTITLLVPSFVIGTDWVLERLERVISLVKDACICDGEGYNFSIWNFTALFLFVVTLFWVGMSLMYFIKVLKAKTKEDTFDKDIKKDSLVHFNYISTIAKFETYKQMADNETDDIYYEDLLSQTYLNAKRCAEKFADYNKGICWLCGAVISLVLFIVSLFFVVI